MALRCVRPGGDCVAVMPLQMKVPAKPAIPGKLKFPVGNGDGIFNHHMAHCHSVLADRATGIDIFAESAQQVSVGGDLHLDIAKALAMRGTVASGAERLAGRWVER